jgi:hypothetical protein
MEQRHQQRSGAYRAGPVVEADEADDR